MSHVNDTRWYGGPHGPRHAPGLREEDPAECLESLEALGRESRRLAEQADRLVGALAARAGLRPETFRCLHLLLREGTAPVHRLAGLAGLDPHEAFAVVAELADAGLAHRGRDEAGRPVVRADAAACRARIDQALRELRESWYALTARRCDDLALVAVLLADGRRLTALVPGLG